MRNRSALCLPCLCYLFRFRSVLFPQDPSPNPPDQKDPDYEFKVEEQEDLCLRGIITPMHANDGEFGVYITPKLV